MKILFVDDMDPISASPFKNVELNYLKKYLPDTNYFFYKNNFSIDKNPILKSEKFDLGFGIGVGFYKYIINIFEKIDLPFCFELYPGFGLKLNDSYMDDLLSLIFKHKLFRGVVITMPLIFRYVTEKKMLNENKILFKYGGFIETGSINQNPPNKVPNIFFIGHPYGDQGGKIKGFDVFYHASKIYKNYNFISYGGWQRPPQKNFKMFGFTSIKEILKNISVGDVLISMNRWQNGHLDGFPTTCAVEAGLVGTTLLLSDLGNNNIHFEDNIDFIQIDDNTILAKLDKILKNDTLRISIGLNGSQKFKKIFDPDDQILSRIDFYEKII